MRTAGMIVEYNPLHCGHLWLMEETRRLLGEDTAILCVMSGDFVQRGDAALVRRHARARAAVESGADLVLELPLPWAVSSAERFADGGVQILAATGLATHLVFGSECGDIAALTEIAACLTSADYVSRLRDALREGASFAACRESAVEALLGRERSALLESPNNILGVEYCKALRRQNAEITPLTVRRKGSGYHALEVTEDTPSAALIRSLLREGQRERAISLMAPAMQRLYREEERAGRAPVFLEQSERAVLARLRTMDEADFAALDEGDEGLFRRLMAAARRETSLEAVLDAAKTRRYARARLRRMVLWAYLGMTPGAFPKSVPYLRLLAANQRGRHLLADMRKTASLPILTKPADVRKLSREAQDVFAWESRAADLYALAYPTLSAAVGGSAWKESPVIL